MASSELAKEVLDYLNEKAHKRFKHIETHYKFINARAKEGYDLDDFKYVIDVKTDEWLNNDMNKFLRPATLFQASKFDGYLNQPKRNNVNDNIFDMEELPF